MAVAKDNQELIVRQSQLQRSIELFTLLGIKPSVQEVCRLSQILTQFIYDGDVKNPDILKFEKAMGIKPHSTIIKKQNKSEQIDAIQFATKWMEENKTK
jgi:hypothetical protein